MGLFKSIFGGSDSKSESGTIKREGAFGSGPDSARIAGFGEEQLRKGYGDIFQTMQNELLAPNFAPRNDAQQSLLKGTIDQLQGLAGTRGVTPTAEGIAPYVSQQLSDFQNQRFSNLSGAFGQQTGARESEIGNIMKLLQLAQPQYTPTSTSSSSSTPGIASGLGSLMGGAGAMGLAFCWVAEVLFGETHVKTWGARYYCKTHDNWFTRLYKKHGKKWAKYLEKHTWLKPLVKPIWELLAYKGMIHAREVTNGQTVIQN